MKPHASSVDGNLVTSADDGSVWAVWQVLPVPQRFAADEDRFAHHGVIARLARALKRPALLSSACQPITPALLEASMTAEAVPSGRLTARVDATVDAYLDSGKTLYERTYWLAAQVHGGSGDRWTERAARSAQGVWRQAWPWIDRVEGEDDETVRNLRVEADELESAVGMTVVRPGAASDDVARPGGLLVRRATVGDVEWLTVRLARRGTDADIALSDWDTPERQASREGMMRLNDCAWSEAYVAEQTRTTGLRRHVVAEVDEGGPYSYQTNLVMAAAPPELFFPGGHSEWLQRASNAWSRDEGVFPVDWCLYVRPRRDRKARKQVESRLTNAQDQPDQTDDGTGVATAEHVLADIDMLTDLNDQVQGGEPKLEVVAWFTICADSYQGMRGRERAFRSLWNQDQWKLTRPPGEQMGLVRASQPGAAIPDVILRDYKRHHLPGRLAAAAPYAGSSVGDPYGALLGWNLGDGLCGPVFLDPGYGIRERNRSGSIIFSGVTGSGKSSTKKLYMEALMTRGSRFVVLDPVDEYLPLAELVDGQIIDPNNPKHSLDPLTIYAGMTRPDVNDRERAIDAAVAIFAPLSKDGIRPFSLQWAELRRLIEWAIDHRLRLADVVRWVTDDTSGVFDQMARPLQVASRIPSLASVFDPNLLPFSARRSLTIIALRGIHLPKKGEEGASAQELQGQSLMTAAFHAAKEAVYEDTSRYGAVVSDEAREPLATEYGEAMMHELFDQGRKKQAGGWFSVTDPEVVPEKLWDQADVRFFFAHDTDRAVSRVRGLLDTAGDDVDIGQVIRELRPGECILRDVRHRISKIHVALPVDAALREAINTTPTLDLTSDNENEDAA